MRTLTTKKKVTSTKYRCTGMCECLEPNPVTNNPLSNAMNKNWKKVMMLPEPGSSLWIASGGGKGERRKLVMGSGTGGIGKGLKSMTVATLT